LPRGIEKSPAVLVDNPAALAPRCYRIRFLEISGEKSAARRHELSEVDCNRLACRLTAMQGVILSEAKDFNRARLKSLNVGFHTIHVLRKILC